MFRNKHRFDLMQFSLEQGDDLVQTMEEFLADPEGVLPVNVMEKLLHQVSDWDEVHLVYVIELAVRHPRLITSQLVEKTLQSSKPSVRLAMYRTIKNLEADELQDAWLDSVDQAARAHEDVRDLPAYVRRQLQR